MKKIPTVKLISTRHEPIGICNSQELYRILENQQPEVIFIEQPPSYFGQYYEEESITSLETEAVKDYLKKYNVDLVLVDLDDVPNQKFFDDYRSLIEKIDGQSNINGYEFRTLMDDNNYCVELHGFAYLNARGTLDFNNKLRVVIEEGLNLLNEPKLFEIYSKWNEVQEVRDNHMLNEIYNYTLKNDFEKGVFLIGSGHRNSIIEKIEQNTLFKSGEINWRL